MTPKQRDRVVKLAGLVREFSPALGRHVYRASSGEVFDAGYWDPEFSFDDCRSLFAEIKRRKLWEDFSGNLQDIHPLILRRLKPGWWCMYCFEVVTPADIVAAFLKTMEDVNREGKTMETLPVGAKAEKIERNITELERLRISNAELIAAFKHLAECLFGDAESWQRCRKAIEAVLPTMG